MSFRHGPAVRQIPTPWLVLVLLLLCYRLLSDGTDSPLQVQVASVASPLPRAVPRGLDVQKLKACAPNALEADQLKALIAEAKNPKRKPPKKRVKRTSPERPGLWRCSDCEQWLPERAFNVENRGGWTWPWTWPCTYCRECDNERGRSHRRTLRGNLLHLLQNARSRAKEKPWDMTLTFEDLLEVVGRQNGRCAYSGVPLSMCLPHSHWRMSLERLNNSEGYTPENCVLIAAEFNSGDSSRHRGVDPETVKGTAQWSLAKVQSVPHLQCQPVGSELLAKDIAEARVVRPRKKRKQVARPTQPDKEEEGSIYCSLCNMFLTPSCFCPSHRIDGRYCKACQRALRSTLRGHVQHCLVSAKSRSKKRCQEFSLTLSQVLDMLEQQRGRCYYSSVPLEYKQIHAPWRLSIERLNNSIGYTEENCVLIAIEFNTPDQSRNKAVTEVFGTAQWSKEKVKHVWGDYGWATLPTSASKETEWQWIIGRGSLVM